MIRRFLILWLTSLTLAGCTLIQPTLAWPTPVRPPELASTADALGAALEGNYPLDALTIHYETGNEAWAGHTTLAIRGSGTVQVTFAQGGQQDYWQATLTENEFVALVQLLVDHEVWSIRGQREAGAPDEAYPTLTIEAEGFEPLVVGMWEGEAREHADLRPILDVLSGLAQQISGGVAK
jgi:hypothetical protein